MKKVKILIDPRLCRIIISFQVSSYIRDNIISFGLVRLTLKINIDGLIVKIVICIPNKGWLSKVTSFMCHCFVMFDKSYFQTLLGGDHFRASAECYHSVHKDI